MIEEHFRIIKARALCAPRSNIHLVPYWGLDMRHKYVFTNSSIQTGCNTRSIFKQSSTGLNSKFSFHPSCHTKAKEPSHSYYLSIAGFIPFPRVLVLCEMQTDMKQEKQHNIGLYLV